VIDPDRALCLGSVDQLDHVRDDLPLSNKIAQSHRGGPSMMAFGVIPRLDIAVWAASMSSTRGVRCHAAIASYRSRLRPPSRLGIASAIGKHADLKTEDGHQRVVPTKIAQPSQVIRNPQPQP
jgi:hypothetical protein